jgi:hypothetical protein
MNQHIPSLEKEHSIKKHLEIVLDQPTNIKINRFRNDSLPVTFEILIIEPQIQFVYVKIGPRSKVKVYTYNNS